MKKLVVVFCSVLILTACNCKSKCDDKAVGDSTKVSCCDSLKKACCGSAKAECDSAKMDSCKKAGNTKCCEKK